MVARSSSRACAWVRLDESFAYSSHIALGEAGVCCSCSLGLIGGEFVYTAGHFRGAAIFLSLALVQILDSSGSGLPALGLLGLRTWGWPVGSGVLGDLRRTAA